MSRGNVTGECSLPDCKTGAAPSVVITPLPLRAAGSAGGNMSSPSRNFSSSWPSKSVYKAVFNQTRCAQVPGRWCYFPGAEEFAVVSDKPCLPNHRQALARHLTDGPGLGKGCVRALSWTPSAPPPICASSRIQFCLAGIACQNKGWGACGVALILEHE